MYESENNLGKYLLIIGISIMFVGTLMVFFVKYLSKQMKVPAILHIYVQVVDACVLSKNRR